MTQKDFNIHLVELVEALEDGFNGAVKSTMETSPGHFFISMPQVLMPMFARGLVDKYGIKNGLIEFREIDMMYRNIKIIPSHEMKISFFHRDYPLREDPILIRQVVISQPAHLKGFSYSGITINKDHYKLEGLS